MSVNFDEKPCGYCGYMVDISSEFCPCCGHVFSVASRYKQIVDEEDDIMFEKERNLIEETKRKFYNSYDEPSLYRRNEKVKRKIYDEPSLYRLYLRETSKTHGNMSSDFNLFEILGGDDNMNKVISRFLCELLSPDGMHGMGTFFLKPFVHDVLNLDIPKFELEKARVFLVEYQYKGTYVSDIQLRINQRLIILSVEIDDESGGASINDKSEWNDAYSVYSLTLHGNATKRLRNDFSGAKLACLSFKYDVRSWLSYCTRQLEVNDGIIYQALSQFSDMIQNLLSGHTNDRSLFTFADFILSSPENTEAALNIHDSIRSIADDLRNRVFAAIRVEFLKMTSWQLNNFKDCAKIGKDGYLYVRSNIRSEWQKCSLWDYGCPNFKFPNKALFELCDKLSFNIFVSRCAKKILKEF